MNIDLDLANAKDVDGWNRFVREGLNHDQSDADDRSNTKYDFSTMSKKFGKFYLLYLQAALDSWLQQQIIMEEPENLEIFCNLNGNVPVGFLNKLKS